jgi:two-component system chemotaxis response regulator CheY
MPFASALRVLIVDDQLTSRLLIRGGLQELGVTNIEMASWRGRVPDC